MFVKNVLILYCGAVHFLHYLPSFAVVYTKWKCSKIREVYLWHTQTYLCEMCFCTCSNYSLNL